MYEKQGLSLREIAERCGLSFPAVHERLARVGVKFRPRHVSAKPFVALINKRTLLSLYRNKRMSVQAIADQLGLSNWIVRKHLTFYGIPSRPLGASPRYPELVMLKVGKSVILPRDKTKHPHHQCHKMARRFGIKVSVRIVDKESMRITRTK
jgi:predicted DNA-binding protein YlxM (UPF0122 family)